MKIAVVTDNKEVSESLREMLGAGHEVAAFMIAENIESALPAFKPEVVFANLTLGGFTPPASGFDILSLVKDAGLAAEFVLMDEFVPLVSAGITGDEDCYFLALPPRKDKLAEIMAQIFAKLQRR